MTAEERASFERLFRSHYAELCDFAVRYVRSDQDAEEIVQDVFLAVWARRGDRPRERPSRAYLFAAVRNHALHHTRHAGVVRRHSETAVADEIQVTPPDQLAESDQETADLKSAIDALPERTRLAIQLRWLRQMSFAEVSEAMGISVKGVEKLVYGGMQALRSHLIK